ncbi:calmodulin-binding protein kinase [Colletotrichum incanum]|uniref:Autophagy-related protein 1 n=1 Tax=Colletotrichum incanum TaxID=1573173 RepID=A0A161VZD5_COLIC|nr:calmodulin-binding protein kinase [Colletotrichum incanum]
MPIYQRLTYEAMDDETLPKKTLFTVHSHRVLFLCDEHNTDFFVSGEFQTYAADCYPALARDVDDGHGQEQDITPAPLLETLPFLRVTTDHEPRDARIGFVFGSDPTVCDVLLDKDLARGISKKQFAIQVNQENGVLLFKNHSRNKTNIRSPSLGKLALRHQRALQENESVHVPLGLYDIEIRLPDHSAHRRDYRTHLSNFIAKVSTQIPDLQNLELESGPSASTTSSGASPYRLQDKIGSGTYGVVYRAVHRVTGDVVAVKQLGKDKLVRLEEAMLLRSIMHEHIVKFHAFIIESDSHLLVMEFVDGPNLEQAFRGYHPSSTELREVIRQQLTAAQFIHHQGIIHRDIKPPNVVLKSRNPMVTKLTDFGLAIRSAELAGGVLGCGTALYAAPEVFNNKVYDEKVDIWSLGIIFLQYSHKLPPFPKQHSKHKGPADWGRWKKWPDAVLQHLQSMPLSPTSRFISAMLTFNPAVRPSAQDALTYPFFSAELDTSYAAETNAELSEDGDTIRASSHRQEPHLSTRSQINRLSDRESPRHATVVLSNKTRSNASLERHAKRRKSERIASMMAGRANYVEVSELPSFRRDANDVVNSQRDEAQSIPNEDEEHNVSTHHYELNLQLPCPPGYKVMSYNNQKIAYHSRLQRVNITSLLRLGNIHRSQGHKWIQSNRCDKIIERGKPYIQGTYILLDSAATCCSELCASSASANALRVIRSDIAGSQAQNNINMGSSEPPSQGGILSPSTPPPCKRAHRFGVDIGGHSIRV